MLELIVRGIFDEVS